MMLLGQETLTLIRGWLHCLLPRVGWSAGQPGHNFVRLPFQQAASTIKLHRLPL